MTQSGGNFLDDLLLGVKTIQSNGTVLPTEPTINFIGASVVDDPGNKRTNVTVSANPHAVSGTGFWHSTSGTLDAAASLVNLSTDTTGILPLTDLAQSGAGTGYVMAWTGTQWAGTSTASVAVTMSGDVTGTTAANTVTQAQSGAITFGSGTTPTIKSSTSATSLTVGTNNAGAVLALQADAAANVMQLAGGTQASFALGANLATAGHIRSPNNFVWKGRNAANTADLELFAFDSADQITFGDTSLASNLIRGANTYIDSATFHLRTASSVETNTLIPSAGIGMTITGGLMFTTRTVTASFTVDTTTTDNVIIVDTTSAAVTVTLPAPTNGRALTIVDKANTFGTNNCTIAQHATEKIDGTAASKTLNVPGVRCQIFSDGTDWYTTGDFGAASSRFESGVGGHITLLPGA